MQIVNPTLALQFIDRALEQNADYTRGLELKAIILHSLERVDEAKALFERCCELEPDHSWSKYLFLGQVFLQLSWFDETHWHADVLRRRSSAISKPRHLSHGRLRGPCMSLSLSMSPCQSL